MADHPDIARALDSDTFEEIDRHFARFVARLAGGDCPEVMLATALVSQRRGLGHICLDLETLAGNELRCGEGEGNATLRCPPLEVWEARLRDSSVVGAPGDFKPLILDPAHRLYLHRYWTYERDLARAIRARLRPAPEPVDWDLFRQGVKRLFPGGASVEVDWQRVALFAAMRGSLTVISGGPGTGKTRTVVTLLALLLEQAQARHVNLRLALAAPTGKAAARIAESIKHAKAALNCADSIRASLPEEAKTLHRLLGAREGSSELRFNASNLLPVDAVVVDEASMVDLALMAKLFAAIPAHARVVLVGDKDQLASVEAGAVLGDLCHPGQINRFSPDFCAQYAAVAGEGLVPATDAAAGGQASNAFVQLHRNYRFGAQSGLWHLSRAINAGDADGAWRLLFTLGPESGVTWCEPPAPSGRKEALRPRIVEGFRACLQAEDSESALSALNRFRVLSALRHGRGGVSELNRLIETILAEAGLITPEPGQLNYHGRSVMVTRNDYPQRLFNGDVGLMREKSGAGLRAFFRGPDGAVRALAPERLPPHESVYAMTVHKSQGSEFDRVLLILPEHESPVLTRELLYTGLTRARLGAELWCTEAAFRRAVEAPVQRPSGLREAVWGSGSDWRSK